MENELQQMNLLFNRLYPLLRSITGKGVRETFRYLQPYIPLKVESVPTGLKVFDWEIPKEWVIREAWIKNSAGDKIVCLSEHNLHVVNYSIGINQKMTLNDLKPHLHTIEHLPDAIPYVISYYKERWGFCMTHHQYEELEEDIYHVYIDAEHINGVLNYGHTLLKGESEKEILLSTYICHPSMANNELSGPLVSTFLYNRIKKWPNRRFSYRFVFIPETIGSITYLARHGENLQSTIYSGAVLTCLGGKGYPLSYKQSRNEDAPLNRIMNILEKIQPQKYHQRGFSPLSGSDERQYCSPGFNLPVGQFSRMIYGQYDGYHNSLDTKEAMTIEALIQSIDEIENILKMQELDGYYVNLKPYGEPKLGKYSLYPDLNSPTNRKQSTNHIADDRTFLNQILMILNYSDGKHSLSMIADKLDCNLLDLEQAVAILKKEGLLEGPFIERQEVE